MDNRPIGFFDSGLGGLSTLSEAVRLLPRENFLYYADSLRAPFGDKRPEEVLEIAEQAIGYLAGRGVKAVVIACNTATGIGAGKLREHYKLDILGVEPALKPACLGYRGGLILCLSTVATARSAAFNALLARVAKGVPVIVKSLPHLAADIEARWGEPAYLRRRLAEELGEFTDKNVGGVVLGCTHYVFVRDLIAEMFPFAALYDGNAGTCRNLANKLEARGMLAEAAGGVELVSSDPARLPLYADVLSKLLQSR